MTQQHNGLGRYTELLSAYSAALGERDSDFSGIERAGETLTPTVDLWSQLEWQFLRATFPYWRRVAITGVAAERSALGVRPAAGTIVVVQRVRANVTVELRITTAVGAVPEASTTGVPRDSRLQQPGAANDRNSRCAIHSYTDTSANIVGTVGILALASVRTDVDWVGVSGRELLFVTTADLTTLDVDVEFT